MDALTRHWTRHWQAQNPRYRAARVSWQGESTFGVEGTDRILRPPHAVAVATMAKALRTEAAKLGHSLNDTLLRLMLGQKLGAEGAMPGLMGTTFAGTNNAGAAQVPGGKTGAAWIAAKALLGGWGAFAHRDSNPPGPGGGPYIGWYYSAPSVEDSAHQWLTGYAGTRNVLTQNPQTPEDYARIMYDSRYFTGLSHDREKEIANYAAAIRRGMGMIGKGLETTPNDPTVYSVDPSQFRSLKDRKITEDLFNAAKNGKQGSAWGFLLPASWDAMVASNGFIQFGAASKIAALQAKGTRGLIETATENPALTAGAAILAGGLLVAVLGGRH